MLLSPRNLSRDISQITNRMFSFLTDMKLSIFMCLSSVMHFMESLFIVGGIKTILIDFFSLFQYFSNAALARTSVASTTVLSSTSGLFTLFVGAFLGEDSLNIAKVVAVFVSMAGVAMTALGKTWATDESQLSAA